MALCVLRVRRFIFPAAARIILAMFSHLVAIRRMRDSGAVFTG